MDRFGLGDRWALVGTGLETFAGLNQVGLNALAARARRPRQRVGMLPTRPCSNGSQYGLDLDPAFVQLWNDQDDDMRFESHAHFVTISDAVALLMVPTGVGVGRNAAADRARRVARDRKVERRSRRSDTDAATGPWSATESTSASGRSLRRLFELPLRLPLHEVAYAIHPSETTNVAALTDAAGHCSTPTSNPDRCGVACGWFRRAVDRQVGACCPARGGSAIAAPAIWRAATRHHPGDRVRPPSPGPGDGLWSFATVDEAGRGRRRSRRRLRAPSTGKMTTSTRAACSPRCSMSYGMTVPSDSGAHRHDTRRRPATRSELLGRRPYESTTRRAPCSRS